MTTSPFKSTLRTLVLIDGFHLNSLTKKHNMNMEFLVFRDLLNQAPLLGVPKYYTTVQITSDGEPTNNIASLLSWLSFNGYNVTQQNVYQINTSDTKEVKYTTSPILMDMCIDAISLYYEQTYQRLLIVSGNREIVPFIKHLRDLGVQIDVISSIDLDAVSQEVRSNCDYFYEFTDLAPLFFRSKETSTT